MNARPPAASDSVEIVADWLELEALKSRRGEISLEALVRVIRRSGSTDALEADPRDRGSEVSQRVAEDAFSELASRSVACGKSPGAYPFDVIPGVLRRLGTWRTAPYVLLLLLSKVEPTTGHGGTSVLFEEICTHAARQYLGGKQNNSDAVRFGSPRMAPISRLGQAVDDLCIRLGEGGGCLSPELAEHLGDDGLDIVAWRNFADKKAGKLVAFGQCAGGLNWWDKLTELDGRKFAQKWFRQQLVADPVRFFFVPRRIPEGRWTHVGIDAGVVFDRCRIVSCLDCLERDLIQGCQRAIRTILAG